MRKSSLLLFLLVQSIFAQNDTASVEQSIFGVQTGFLGTWVHNEYKLTNSIALRTEAGVDMGFSISQDNDVYVLVPVIRAEPRWYYNLEKRVKKGRSIQNNSGNFLALSITYNPDWFVVSDEKNIDFISQISFIPKWGIKRTVGNHFTYETGIGVGYVKYLESYPSNKNQSDVGVDLHLRIGYTF